MNQNRPRDDTRLGLIHRLSAHHRAAVLESERCGCFFCLRTFAPSAIANWADGGRTANCPYCDIDAVLPGSVVPIDDALLSAMCERWFCTPVEPSLPAPGLSG